MRGFRPLAAFAAVGALALLAGRCGAPPRPRTPPPEPTPSLPRPAPSTAPSPRVAGLISSMTVEEKVGQLFVVGSEGSYLADDDPRFERLRRLVLEEKVGGLLWLRSQVQSVASADARLQALAKLPLLVAADLEAGAGMRFPDLVWGSYAMAVAATGDLSLARRRARNTAVEARALGINQVYAPVADVNVDPRNPVINVRSFGEVPEEVGRWVGAVVEGLQEGGVTAVLKHFPGHGDTSVDSHLSLPVLPFEKARLEAVELVPFRAGLAAGARGVMSAHLSVPRLDATPAPPLPTASRGEARAKEAAELETNGTLPASLSPLLLDGLLRKELAFDGLVVTDAMNMGALSSRFPPGEAAVRALLAGNDMVLNPPDPRGAVAAAREAASSGRLPRERLDRAVARVLSEKERLGLFEERSPRLDLVTTVAGRREHVALEEEIAARSLTLVREAAGALPLRPGQRLFHLVVVDEPNVPGLDARVGEELARRLGEVPAARLGPGSCGADVEAAVAAASEAELVLVSLFVRARSGAGRIAAPPAGKEALQALLSSGKPVVAVAFGSPYLLLDFPSIPTYLVAYGPQEVVQSAAAAALLGEAPIGGRLPVTLPGLHPRGTGIRKEVSR